jgi:hypothetical protein
MIHGESSAIQNRTAIYWIKTLIEVADNDPSATQNWYIPALTMDYHGYMMDMFWENEGSLNTNEEKNAYFQEYATGIIRQVQKLIDRSY